LELLFVRLITDWDLLKEVAHCHLRVFSFRAGAICRCLSDEEGGGLGAGVEIVTV